MAHLKPTRHTAPPPTDSSDDNHTDEGLAESKRKIAHKGPKWLDELLAEVEAEGKELRERMGEVLLQG